MIKIITTFKKIMTRILLILLCLPMLFSCDQENKVYNAFIGEKGEKIVQMVKKDDINKVHPTFRVIRQSCRAYNLSLK